MFIPRRRSDCLHTFSPHSVATWRSSDALSIGTLCFLEWQEGPWRAWVVTVDHRQAFLGTCSLHAVRLCPHTVRGLMTPLVSQTRSADRLDDGEPRRTISDAPHPLTRQWNAQPTHRPPWATTTTSSFRSGEFPRVITFHSFFNRIRVLGSHPSRLPATSPRSEMLYTIELGVMHTLSACPSIIAPA